MLSAIAHGRDADVGTAVAIAAAAASGAATLPEPLRMLCFALIESSLGDAQLAVMITNPSQDVREGGAAFREKRTPKFEGR